jgi:hypothetical protein
VQGGDVKSYFTGEDKIIIAKQRQTLAGRIQRCALTGRERQVGGEVRP